MDAALRIIVEMQGAEERRNAAVAAAAAAAAANLSGAVRERRAKKYAIPILSLSIILYGHIGGDIFAPVTPYCVFFCFSNRYRRQPCLLCAQK